MAFTDLTIFFSEPGRLRLKGLWNGDVKSLINSQHNLYLTKQKGFNYSFTKNVFFIYT